MWTAHGSHVSDEGPGHESPIASVSHILPESEQYRHARLIAAAPDLLTVARSCLAYLESLPRDYCPDPAWLRAAIAKATGE